MKKRTIIRSAAVLLTATMLTGCEIGNTEITFDIKHTNKHVAFAVNDTKCSIKFRYEAAPTQSLSWFS